MCYVVLCRRLGSLMYWPASFTQATMASSEYLAEGFRTSLSPVVVFVIHVFVIVVVYVLFRLFVVNIVVCCYVYVLGRLPYE